MQGTPISLEEMKFAADAVAEHGSIREASRQVDMSYATLHRWYKRAKENGIVNNPGDCVKSFIPDGLKLKGRSTLYDAQTGEAKLVWEKTSQDLEARQEALEAFFNGLKEQIEPCKPVLLESCDCNAQLLNQYTLTDYHIGMLAWGEESGEDFDLDIAEKLLIKWFANAIEQSPKAECAVFAQIGDFLHFDGYEPVTPAHKHLLDTDSRFRKVVRCAIRVSRKIIEMLAKKYPKVHVIYCDANHDPVSEVWLSEWLSVLYMDNPRITVDTSADTYYSYEWGNVGLFYHHGHKRKPDNISTVFAAKFRGMFGRTKFSYAHLGHLHHQKVLEDQLMIIEQHPTLAAKDAYAAKGGWYSMRRSSVITYHKEYGEVGRVTISPDMLR